MNLNMCRGDRLKYEILPREYNPLEIPLRDIGDPSYLDFASSIYIGADNLFVMQTMTGKEQTEVAWASLPFFLMLVLTVVLITLFPVTLVTGLPEWLLAR